MQNMIIRCHYIATWHEEASEIETLLLNDYYRDSAAAADETVTNVKSMYNLHSVATERYGNYVTT